MKIGLDFHKVLDNPPIQDKHFWQKFTKLFVTNGHEVHIVTGTQLKPEFIEKLKEMDISYTHIYSISSDLIEKHKDVKWEDPDNPWFDDDVWNKAKANYCHREGIDIHFDDSDEYCKYFSNTLYFKLM